MTKRYRITSSTSAEIIESDKVEYMPTTGQTLFYLNDELFAICPASYLVIEIKEDDENN